jgi:hypothetical protein
MFDLRHNVEVPAYVSDRARCLSVTLIVLEEVLAFQQSDIVISNDFEQRILVTTQPVSVPCAMIAKRLLGSADGFLELF